MTILELKDSKAQILEANDRLFETADAEKRSLTETETNTVESNLKRVAVLDLKMESESRKAEPKGYSANILIKTAQPKETFSLMKSIMNVVSGKPQDDVTRDLMTLGRLEFRSAGINAVGSIVIPAEVRADILAGSGTAGAEIVSEDKRAILPPLEAKMVLAQAGATFLKGLVGDVSIPNYAGTTAAWATEVAAITETGGAFAEVNFSPKRIAAVLDVSKRFLLQDGIGAERMLLDNIASAVAHKLEATILGKTTAVSTTSPGGMAFAITTGVPVAVAAPTHANMIALETTVDTANALAGNLAYITNSAGRGKLKQTVLGPSGVGRMLLENGEMNGYPVYVTNAAPATCGAGSSGNLVAFGNWADLCVAQWGGYDITIDPYTVAHEGQVRIVINAYFDAKGLRGTVASGSGFNDYITSFSTLAIV